MSEAALCFLHFAAGSGAEQGVSLSTQKLHSGLPARPPLLGNSAVAPQGRLGGRSQANSGGPHYHPSSPPVQIPPRRVRCFSFCRELAACYPRWSGAARKSLNIEVEGPEGAGTACIVAFPCFRGLCVCKTGRVADPFLIVQPYLNNGVCMRFPDFSRLWCLFS